ncbi:Hypothetical protein FKW44_016101 [Caligus rogercresseyi]|uniref:Uncharacterized protein n=1 Tax=Caligus rogercresseyi TaxID=217165 RepID=A0A7T8H1F2_CALRO|nr:Hypothetical protein FKW44_016101 [Caligus rogercresseyi]
MSVSNEAVEMWYPWKRDHQRKEWLPLEKLQTPFQQIQTIALVLAHKMSLNGSPCLGNVCSISRVLEN